MTPDLHTLSGAFAVDALDRDERREFERHLAACESCQQEVAELQATAAMLAVSSEETPPPSMKAAVLAEIDKTRQERPMPAVVDMAERRSRRLSLATFTERVAAVAAAILAVAVIGLGTVIGSLNDRIGEMEARSERMQALLTADDTQTVTMESPDGGVARVLVSESAGEAVVYGTGMAPAPDGRDYELWFIHEDAFVPAGILTVGEDGTVTHTVRGNLDGVIALGVTVEPEGGSPQPTTDPIMFAELSA